MLTAVLLLPPWLCFAIIFMFHFSEEGFVLPFQRTSLTRNFTLGFSSLIMILTFTFPQCRSSIYLTLFYAFYVLFSVFV